MKSYDIYVSYYEKEQNVKLVFETIDFINRSGFGCWYNNQLAFKQCPVVICFISDVYVKWKCDEVKLASSTNKIIFPVLLKKIKLSETPIGDIINENKTKYYATFKKDIDWRKMLMETLLEKLKRIVIDESTVCPEMKFNSIQTYPGFSQLNRLCTIGDFILIGDWEYEVGVHVLNSKLEYKFTFNNDRKFKRVTGICSIKNDKIVVVSSIPQSRDQSIFVILYKLKTKYILELTCLYEYNQADTNDMIHRDLCGIGYCETTNRLYVVDRNNCSLLEFKNDLSVLQNGGNFIEHVLYSKTEDAKPNNNNVNQIPAYFDRPLFVDISIKQSGTIYLTDHLSKSESGNACVHMFEIKMGKMFWKMAIGTMELQKPIVSIPLKNNMLMVLERKGSGLLKVYDGDGSILNNFIINEIDHPRNMHIIGTKIIFTNLTNKLYVYNLMADDVLYNRNTSINLKITAIDELHKLFNVFVSYNQSSSKLQALELYDMLEENDYGCWMDINVSKIEKEKEILIGLKKCSTMVCFLTNKYLVSPICNKELETGLSTKTCVILAQMENIEQANIDYLKATTDRLSNNLTKVHFLDFSNYENNWKDEILNTINHEFGRNKQLCKSETMHLKLKVGNPNFKTLNRLHFIDKFILIGDWELNVGVHILNQNYEYIRSFNNNNKFKRISGICKVRTNEVAFISSIPDTETFSVSIMKYSIMNDDIKFDRSFEYNQKINKKAVKRDACGCEYNKETKGLLVIDRQNCSILEFSNILCLLSEINVKELLPEHFNEPVLRDIKIKSDFIYLTDTFSVSKNLGNDCLHVFNKNYKWVKSIGVGQLKSPCIFSTNSNTELIGVLCRTNPGYILYFNTSGCLLRKHKLESSEFPKAVYEFNGKILTTNGKTNMDVYSGLNVISNDYINLSIFNQFMHF